MSDYQIIKQESVNGVLCDFYTDGSGEFYMSRRQIGEALEYADPRKAIANIHAVHKERLDKFSGVLVSRTPGGCQEMILYSAKGIYEICRWSQQPKADAFYDRVYDILEGLRSGQLKVPPMNNPEFKRAYEIFDTIIMDFFRCMEKALQEKRYYLLPRTNGAEYCKPDPETLGLFDYQYYYIYNRRATSLFDEIHPEIPMRAVWNLLSLLGITENYSRKQVGSVITFMGRKAYAVRLIRSKCPIELTTYGENRYLLVEKRYVEEDEYKALMLSSTDENSEERS